ncbi:MAG: SNF2-related protein [Bacteroidota bacterium]
MERTESSQTSIDFKGRFLDNGTWPDQKKYPLNIKGLGRNVEELVLGDIQASTDYLIITGFTSLSHVIDVFGNNEYPKLSNVRILLGFEPLPKGRKSYETEVNLSKEIREYWLKCGLSITLGGAAIRLIELIRSGRVQFKFRNRSHAKIYVGDEDVILGSSNFSRSGLFHQLEANLRFNKNARIEKERYIEIKRIAENFYDEGTNYNHEMISLLEQLIAKVTWQEALARAISEVIEGSWLSEYVELTEKLTNAKLWPTQWRGIAHAMNVLQTSSNVLIADPTGSGKTKLCSSLVLTLIHWLWENGKRDKSDSVIVCPPLVIPFWQKEFRNLSHINHNQVSMGVLSNGKPQAMKAALEEIALAKILTIDEAHNYIRPHSNRSRAIQSHQADHVILATATPINKRADDLLRLIQLLDVDNLSDEDFKVYKNLREQPRTVLEKSDLDNLRKFISQFTIRRTKTELNRQIEKEDDKYLNSEGNKCRFPVQNCRMYKTAETASDIDIVSKINAEIKKLNGLTHLRRFSRPDFELDGVEGEKIYINTLLSSGKALASFMIREALRSSHAALVEHIAGTLAARSQFEFKTKKSLTGNTLNKLIVFKEKMPDISDFSPILFPSYLIDEKEYSQKVDDEINAYTNILSLAKGFSGKREKGKAAHLLKQYYEHGLILGFDSTVISLDLMKQLIHESDPQVPVHVVSGSENDAVLENVLQMCSLGSTANAIILCSDRMNEGVNMQQARSVTLLDMPSVLRIAEQRIGRIDRMDSPHDEIEAWWPDDSEEYSLKGDKRLVDTSILAESIYGSNLSVPKVLKDRHYDGANEMISEYHSMREKDPEWEGITDSFRPVIELKEGNSAIIDEATYDRIKDIQGVIKTRVSFVNSYSSWVFFALRGTKDQSPRWYFMDHQGTFHTEYPAICKQLRDHLTGNPQTLAWDQQHLDKFIERMRQEEVKLLPNKRKRALAVAQSILNKKLKYETPELIPVIQEVLRLFNASSKEFIIDYYRFAEQWIKILQPYLNEKREQAKRKRRVFNLNSLVKDHRTIKLSHPLLLQILENCPYTDRVDNKIVSCIIGVSAPQGL